MAPVLGYWAIRGLAQPIRLLLAYTGTEFEDKKYNCGPAPDYDRSEWLDEKFTLGLSFPNLPYYIDGDLKLTQSTAILRYLARQHKLDGTTEQEKTRIDLAEGQLVDIRSGYVGLSYNPKFEELREDFVKKTLPPQIKQLSQFLGDYKWFAGDNITYVDFMIYEVLDQLQVLSPDILKESKNLQDFLTRFETEKKIAEYMKSDRFMKYPFNGKMAKFGGN